ncbi:MAG TPA: amidohydrolase [Edaphocola sp.]|nr:amidohydrolase [Edaphocola sp.]
MKSLNIAALQIDIFWEDKMHNLEALSQTISGLDKDSHIVFLPEMFATGFSMNPGLAEPMDGGIVNWMRQTAQHSGKIICGSVMIRDEDHIYNRLMWMLPNGMWHYYDKRHLFAYGGEDRIFRPGNNRIVVQANGWKICLMICYDLRFPVWCRQQPSSPYDILVFVANWPERRRLAWKTLLQARAIENQCYVLGVNRVGQDGLGIAHCGDSLLVDPIGKIVNGAPERQPAIIQATLNGDLVQDTRAHFPFLKDADSFLLV